MKNNHPITQRELELIKVYSYCQLGMSPQKFLSKWKLNYAQVAQICDRSTTTVSLWFARGRNYRRPTKVDLRHLALMDFILEHFEEIPTELRNLLCPQNRD